MIELKPNLSVIDLGCGTGELTVALANHLPECQILGIDASETMLAKASLLAHDRLQFKHQSIELLAESYDLIFSHAALQWLDRHSELLAKLWSHLNPGGQLAIQMPSNHAHLTHRLIQRLAQEKEFQTALKGYQRVSPVLQIEDYATMLYQLGANDIQVFEKIYPHVFENADSLLEWVKGTAMVPYLERLSPELQAQWLERYRQEINQAFPQTPVFYPFRRILISAKKAAE